MVPRAVAITVLTTASTRVFLVAAILSGLSNNLAYHSVVKPIHGPPCFAVLNEKMMTTTIGAYMKTYRKIEINQSGSGTRFTATHRLFLRRTGHRPTNRPAPHPSR